MIREIARKSKHASPEVLRSVLSVFHLLPFVRPRILSCILIHDDPTSIEARCMSNLTIEVWDATGNKKQLVELPADAPVNRVIAVLVEKMNLPRYSPDGQLMSYKFHHKASGRQLLDDQTLASADIHNGDVLRLQPEITAGAGEDTGQPLVTTTEMTCCLFCGERILAGARKCRYCGEYLDPELRDARAEISAFDRLFAPFGRPASAIVAGYLGLFSVLPFFGILAIIVSLIAFRTLKQHPQLRGRGRAWFGLVMGIIMTLAYAIAIAVVAIGA